MATLKHIKAITLVVILMTGLMSALSGAAGLRQNLADEYQVKAAFILNFARLIQWPASKRHIDEPFNICVMGNEILKTTFTMVNDQQINGQSSELIIISRSQDIRQCHILMISGIKQSNMRQIFKFAHQHSILTISELTDINHSGAIVNFIHEGNKIKFQINNSSALQSGLKISSRLLKLAIIKNS